jgi:tetratricopeptide (TPR) repeat protein
MDYEITLNQALDLLADGEEKKAERILQGIIDHIKARLNRKEATADLHYYWGRALTAMDEPEQALLRFEKALEIDIQHEPTLWETASIFLHDLDRPESAAALLKEKLLPLSPDNADYLEALRLAEFTLRLKKQPPPVSGAAAAANGATPDADAKPGFPAGTPPGPGSKARSDTGRRDREAALQAEADALLAESGDWSPEGEPKD